MDKRRIIIEIEVKDYADNSKIIEGVKEWIQDKFENPETASIVVETIEDKLGSYVG